MQSEENKNGDKYFENILLHLTKFVQEFRTTCEKDEQYMIMFEFGDFLIQKINDESIFRKCILFIDEALEKGSSITEEVIALQVFQQLYSDRKHFDKVRNTLNKNSKIILDYFKLQFEKSYPNQV